MKIKLKKISNIEVFDEIDPNKEYLVALKCSPDGVFTSAQQDDHEPEKTYHLSVLHVLDITPLGEKPLKFKEGKTPSQNLKSVIYLLGRQLNTEDDEAFYREHMDKITEHYRNKLI